MDPPSEVELFTTDRAWVRRQQKIIGKRKWGRTASSRYNELRYALETCIKKYTHTMHLLFVSKYIVSLYVIIKIMGKTFPAIFSYWPNDHFILYRVLTAP